MLLIVTSKVHFDYLKANRKEKIYYIFLKPSQCSECTISQAISVVLTLKVRVVTIDAQWEGIGEVGSARYEPALLPPCPTIRVLSYSN